MDEPLFDVARETRPTRSGECELPILYRDGSWVGLFYRVPMERARALLGHDAIEPWPVLGGAVCAVYAWEYRDSSIGPYGELGLGVQARLRGAKPSLLRLARDMGAQDAQGIWVVNLPVTTQAACDAGIELWGYPKYVTPIETSFGAGVRVRLGDELELAVPGASRTVTMAGQPVTTYTAREGSLLRTVVRVSHPVRWSSGRGAGLTVLGDGPTARSVRALGIADRAPLAVARTDAFRAVLPAGVELRAGRAGATTSARR